MSEPLAKIQRSLPSVAANFERFSQDTAGRSLLYSILSKLIADDSDLLQLASHAQAGQPAPNLLFGAVQHRLFQNPEEPLASFYKSLTSSPRPPKGAFILFKEFCKRHQSELVDMLRSRRVQTNEVGRCSYLILAFDEIFGRANHPIALIEVGTSAGLNLNWDRYAYIFDPSGEAGDQPSPVVIRSKLRGKGIHHFGTNQPEVFSRVGVDLRIVDVNQADEASWLLALVWPEQDERRRNLMAAMDLWTQNPHTLIEADANLVLRELIDQAPIGIPVVVFNTHTLYQLPPEKREVFSRTIRRAAKRRPVYHLSAEWLGTSTPELWLHTYAPESTREERLALVDQHGEWIEWQDEG